MKCKTYSYKEALSKCLRGHTQADEQGFREKIVEEKSPEKEMQECTIFCSENIRPCLYFVFIQVYDRCDKYVD